MKIEKRFDFFRNISLKIYFLWTNRELCVKSPWMKRLWEVQFYLIKQNMGFTSHDEIWHSRYRKAICQGNERAFSPPWLALALSSPLSILPFLFLSLSLCFSLCLLLSTPPFHEPHGACVFPPTTILTPVRLSVSFPFLFWPLYNRDDVQLFKSSCALAILIIATSREDQTS